MPTEPEDRINVILDADHRALVDAIAERFSHRNRSAAIRYALEQLGLSMGLWPLSEAPKKRHRRT